LSEGANAIALAVTAEDGTTVKTYTVTVTRAETGTEPASSDATLQSLNVSVGTLNPTFDPETYAYSVEVENAVATITVTGVPNSDNAAISDNSGASQSLSEGANAIALAVTAEDGTTVKTYTVTVTWASAQIKTIAMGNHSFAIKTDGTLWGTGRNIYSQLGLGTTTNQYTFTQIPIYNVKAVAVGTSFSLVLKNDGTLWVAGENTYGQTGLGLTSGNTTTFTQIPDIANVKDIATGDTFAFALQENGTLLVAGKNTYGQLGLGTTTDQTTFVAVTTDVKAVAAGLNHALILKTDGKVYVAGSNTNGVIGRGTSTANTKTFTEVTGTISGEVKAVAANNNVSFILTADHLYGTGAYRGLGLGASTVVREFTEVSNVTASEVKSIAVGQNSSFIIKNDNSLWGAGYNSAGELGQGNTTTFSSAFISLGINVKEAAASCRLTSALFLKTDGTLWAAGNNTNGVFGLGTSAAAAYTTFEQVSAF
jgi:alpha-tubulin suppressor-like RCC1 family protein